MSVPVEVTLRLPDGRVFVCHSEIDEQYAERHDWWWTDGNGACDCNRSLYLNQEHGLNLGTKDDDDDDVPCLPCGHTIELLSLKVGGVERLNLSPPSAHTD